MEDLVFSLDNEPVAQPAYTLPYEQTAPAAASTIRELQALLTDNKSEAECMVSLIAGPLTMHAACMIDWWLQTFPLCATTKHPRLHRIPSVCRYCCS